MVNSWSDYRWPPRFCECKQRCIAQNRVQNLLCRSCRSRTLYPAELRSLIYEKRRYSVFQSCKEVNFQWWSIRGLTTVDHRFFASVNHAVSNKRKTKTCHVAVVGGQCSIQLSYDRIYWENAMLTCSGGRKNQLFVQKTNRCWPGTFCVLDWQ